MATTYAAEVFFDGDQLRHGVQVTVDNGVVVSIDPCAGSPDYYLISPGLIDLQMNGFGSVDVSVADNNDFRALDEELLRHGTTAWLATIVTAPLEKLTTSIRSLGQRIATTSTGCYGVHIEGPFLGNAPGAHNPAWIIPFEPEWIRALSSDVKLITVAPEQPKAETFISQLVQQGVVVSLGHTRATDREFQAAASSGATMVTHLFNGMSGVHHREEGVALQALTTPSVVAGVIADLVHVSPSAVQLAFVAKGSEGVCLVSDSVAWASEWAQRRGIAVTDGAPRLPDGTLAGSSTPLSTCVRNVVQACGVSLQDALTSATKTPATLLGYPQMGCIAPGQRADLVMFDEGLSVVNACRGLVSIRG